MVCTIGLYEKNRALTVKVQEGETTQLLKEYVYTNVGSQLRVEETVHTDAATRYTTTYWYDYLERLVKQTNPDGGVLTWQYRTDGQLASETNALSGTTYYTYDALKNCTGIWMPCDSKTYTYQGMRYNRDGKLLTQIQGVSPVSKGNVSTQVITLSYEYDEVGRLSSFTDGNNTKTTYRYDLDGRCISEEVINSPTQTILTTYEYAHRSEPVKVIVYTEEGEELATSYEYDKDGRVTKETAPDGTVTTYRYNDMGSCLGKQMTGPDGTVWTEGYAYDRFGRLSRTTDARGYETSYEYDGFGNLTKVTDGEGGITLYTYNMAGERTAEITPENYIPGAEPSAMSRTEYLYDYAGRVKAVTEVTVENETETENRIAFYTYDLNGNLTSVLDGNRNETTYKYTPAGKLKEVLTPEAAEAGKAYALRYSYDALGRVLKEENGLGGSTAYTYDGADNVLTVTKRATVTYEYDGMGNLLSETTSAGLVTTYTYNTLGQMTSMTVTGVEGMADYTETYCYDLGGRVVSVTDSIGAVTKTSYDGLGNVTEHSVSDAEGGSIQTESYTYDENGNVRTYTDPEGVTTTYTYDALNRVTSETVTVSGKEQTVGTEYDGNGNVTAEEDTFGNRTSYIYDAFDRLTTVVSADGIVLVSYIYDPAGNCIRQTDALNKVTEYKYNGGGQVTETRDAEGNVTVQTYDALGNVAAATDGENNTTAYTYDGFGRLLTVTTADNTKTTYTYDAWGNLRTQTDGKNNKTEYTYNAANLLLTKKESGTVVATYTYNGDGSVATMTDANGTVNTYVYNVYGELVSETATGADGTESTYKFPDVDDSLSRVATVADEEGNTSRLTYDAFHKKDKGIDDTASLR